MASKDPETDIFSNDPEGGKRAPALADDTASSSRGGDNEDSETDDGEGSDDENDHPMPLLSYTRLFGSLPRRQMPTDANPNFSQDSMAESRTFALPSTCAVMAEVNLSTQSSTTSGAAASSSSPETGPDHIRTPDGGRRSSPQSQHFVPYGDPLLSQQPHYVMALGYDNGSVDLVDPRTGVAVVSQQLKLRESTHHQPEMVVDLSMDSTGSFLAAIDTGRMAVIWEFQYTIALQSTPVQNSVVPSVHATSQQLQHTPTTPSEAGVFSSFMSALTLGGSAPTALPLTSEGATSESHAQLIIADDPSMVPRLAISSMQLSRITYPKSFGVPTCIAIDPTYSRKRDKAVLVGFLDGRLVLTKRGLIFQRRTDAIIYQGTYNEDSDGIEAIEWRGSLAAWADAR